MELNYNVEKLRVSLENFKNALDLRCAVYDLEGNTILRSSRCPVQYFDEVGFCHYMRSNFPAFHANCSESDRSACQQCHLNGSDMQRYVCHMGLSECCVPIKKDDIYLGYFISGAICLEGSRDKVYRQLLQYTQGFPERQEKAMERLLLLPVKTTGEVNAIFGILQACGSFLAYSGAIAVQEKSISWQIDHYIQNHLSEDLATSALCSRFGINKTTLNNIAADLYGVSIQKLIRKKRIDASCSLLSGTSLRINEIAEQVGIGDYNYFTKVFRSQMSVSPRTYRRQLGVEADSDQRSAGSDANA